MRVEFVNSCKLLSRKAAALWSCLGSGQGCIPLRATVINLDILFSSLWDSWLPTLGMIYKFTLLVKFSQHGCKGNGVETLWEVIVRRMSSRIAIITAVVVFTISPNRVLENTNLNTMRSYILDNTGKIEFGWRSQLALTSLTLGI